MEIIDIIFESKVLELLTTLALVPFSLFVLQLFTGAAWGELILQYLISMLVVISLMAGFDFVQGLIVVVPT